MTQQSRNKMSGTTTKRKAHPVTIEARLKISSAIFTLLLGSICFVWLLPGLGEIPLAAIENRVIWSFLGGFLLAIGFFLRLYMKTVLDDYLRGSMRLLLGRINDLLCASVCVCGLLVALLP